MPSGALCLRELRRLPHLPSVQRYDTFLLELVRRGRGGCRMQWWLLRSDDEPVYTRYKQLELWNGWIEVRRLLHWKRGGDMRTQRFVRMQRVRRLPFGQGVQPVDASVRD